MHCILKKKTSSCIKCSEARQEPSQHSLLTTLVCLWLPIAACRDTKLNLKGFSSPKNTLEETLSSLSSFDLHFHNFEGEGEHLVVNSKVS